MLASGLLSRANGEPTLRPVSDGHYQLHFYHTHTREKLDVVYRNSEGYDHESLARINRYLRDYRTGDIHEYDPRVFDLLHDLTCARESQS